MHNNNIEYIAPNEFVEHPQHAKFFLAQEEKTKTASYHESVDMYGKINPVIYIEVGGQKQVIDGWGYVLYAIENGLPLVAAQRIDLTNDEDIIRVMLELQFSDHGTPEEEYKMYKAGFETLSKGKGYRSDLTEATASPAELTENKIRRDSIYDKIAAMTNAASGSRVKQILRIGDTNYHYMEKIRQGKISVNNAYLFCNDEKKGKVQNSPKVNAIVFTSDITATPQFSEPSSTQGEYTDEVYTDGADIPECKATESADMDQTGDAADDTEYYSVKGFCVNCGVETTVKVHKNNLPRQWNTQI